MKLHLPQFSEPNKIKTRLLLTAFILQFYPQMLFAQTDSDSLVLKRPTKVFSALGGKWQRNGDNYQALIGSNVIKGINAFEDVYCLTHMPDEMQRFYLRRNNSVMTTDVLNSPGFTREIGFSMSYENTRPSKHGIVKEVRLGAALSEISLGERESVLKYTIDPNALGVIETSYSYAITIRAVSIRTDVLWNFTPLLRNRIRFYAGTGLRLSPALLQSITYKNLDYKRTFDSLSNQNIVTAKSNLPANNNTANIKTGFHYGAQALVGIKFNTSCRTTWYLEVQKSVNFNTFFGAETYIGSSTLIAIGFRKRLHYYDLAEIPANPGLTVPPVY